MNAQPTFSYLTARIDDVEKYAALLLPQGYLRDDIEAVTEEVISYIAQLVDLSSLNSHMEALSSVDIESLRRAAAILKGLELGDQVQITSQATIVPAKAVTELTATIEKLNTDIRTMDELSVAYYIDMIIESSFRLLLACATEVGADLAQLRAMVLEKLNLLPDDQVVSVWDILQDEWDPARSFVMQDLDSRIPQNFLKFDSPQSAREKIAKYVVDLKPAVMLAMQRRGLTGYPLIMITLSRILSWNSSAAAKPASQQEALLARAIGCMSAIAQRLFDKEPAALASILNVPTDSRLLAGPAFQEANIEFTKQRPSYTAVFFELRKITRIAESLIKYESQVERALRQYKLGIEVMTPEICAEFKNKRELLLQKELCRFLLERDIFSVGTKFGKSETDLIVEEPSVRYIIETKVFKREPALSKGAVKRALVQLQNYMDQSPSTPRGILVLYNLSETLLTAEQKWLNGRYWILPINLQVEPPSGRKRSMVIEAGTNGQLIEIIETHNVTKPRKRRPSSPKA